MDLGLPTIFTGMSRPQLQALLVTLQQAYVDLITGNKPVQASYSQGDGARQTTFTAAQATALQVYIFQLQEMLGLVRHARRPMRFLYGSNRAGRPW